MIATLQLSAHWITVLRFPGSDLDDILARARQMDHIALGQIHDRFYPEVYRYVRFRLDDEQACEDITSEVFLRLLDALNKRRGPVQNLRGWLIGTASNIVNDTLRQRYRQPEQDLDGKPEAGLIDEATPDGAWEISWEHEQVRNAISQLTDEQRQVLALRFSEERSLEETAKLTGKNVNAVKALQFRALAALRRWIVEEREVK